MTSTTRDDDYDLEDEIGRWRRHAEQHRRVGTNEVDELEDHLRSQVDDLTASGLQPDEAFLIAIKRMGALDDLSREFARDHSERLWKQLVLPVDGGTGDDQRELAVVLTMAVGAALAVKVPELFGIDPGTEDGARFLARNAGLLVLPFLTGYLGWKRGLPRTVSAALIGAFVVAGLLANLYPFGGPGHTEALVALHLPIALWFGVGVAYVGGQWQDHDQRLDFVRFSGEWFVYLSLLGLGGLVLMVFTGGAFGAIGIGVDELIVEWILPCGAAGAVVVAAGLVEAKQGVIENIAPVLTRLFTPLFDLLLVTFLVTLVVTRSWIDVDRDVLIFFDLLLVVVLALLLYSLSARPIDHPPMLSDRLSLVLIVAALAIDALVLSAIVSRISEFGFSANKAAALGENVVLLVNLAVAAWLYLDVLRGRRPFAGLLRWQTGYLPVIAAWAAFVVVAFPPLFDFA